eukprot:6028253-Pleurochrysis_carterae.AAC.1
MCTHVINHFLERKWLEVELTYLLAGHVAKRSRACHARTMATPAGAQASEKFSPPAIPLRHFCEGGARSEQ